MGCGNLSDTSTPKSNIICNNIREMITFDQPISSNSNSCLLRGKLRKSMKPIFIRFISIKGRSKEKVEKKILKIHELKLRLTHLVPYKYIGSNLHYYYLVMEDFGYKGLLDALVSKDFKVTGFNLWFGLRGIIGTLNVMHNSGICHGQISPVKILTHKGVCYLLDPTTGLESATELLEESLYYAAPEVLNGGVPSPESDVWSLGALIYYLITGKTVYPSAPMDHYLNIVATEEPSFKDLVWKNVSPELVTLIKNMLKRGRDRIEIIDIMKSDWFHKTGIHKTTDLMGYGDFLLDEISSQKTISESVNVLANEMSIQRHSELLNQLESMDYMHTGKVSLKFLLEKVLDPEHEFFQRLEKGDLQVEYANVIESAKRLNSLIIPERMAGIFYKYSKGNKYLKKKEMKHIMYNYGMSIILDNESEFERHVKNAQKSPRDKVDLTYEEFFAFFSEKRYNLSEEMIFM